MPYDSKGDTLDHIRTVQALLTETICALLERAKSHDASKLKAPEKEYFDKWTPKLSSVTYGSDEYRDMLKQMRPAIEHHQQNNRHHPEYYGKPGIESMNLIDLIEMICDWKAATMRHDDGDIWRSLEINKDRFDTTPGVFNLLVNTVAYLEW